MAVPAGPGCRVPFPTRRLVARRRHPDPLPLEGDALGGKAAGLVSLVAGRQPTVGVGHPPPRQPVARRQHRPDRPGRPRRSGVGSDVAVGAHLAGLQPGDGLLDPGSELGPCRLV